MDVRRKFGDIGEKLAIKFLKKKKYKVICTNYRCFHGEIDIIAIKKKELIFIEVKTRKKLSILTIEQIGYNKQLKIIKTAEHFYNFNSDLSKYESRFDIILIQFSENMQDFSIDHIKDAFDAISF